MNLSPNFTLAEFVCKCGCGEVVVDARLVMALQAIRDVLGPLTITSGYRCVLHNARVGGEKNSMHMRGLAADVVPPMDSDIDELVAEAWKLGYVNGIGTDRERGFVHIDVRKGPTVRWTYVNGKAVHEAHAKPAGRE